MGFIVKTFTRHYSTSLSWLQIPTATSRGFVVLKQQRGAVYALTLLLCDDNKSAAYCLFKHHRLFTIEQYPMLGVPFDRAREGDAFDVAANGG